MGKKFQIIVTLGPSVTDKIVDLIHEGATAFRLNCSHLTLESISRWLIDVEKALKKTGEKLPIWLDLQGAKLRIGKLLKPIQLKKNDQIYFINSYSQIDDGIPLPHKEIFQLIQEDDDLLLDDGKIRLRVGRITENRFYAEVMRAGELNSFKGFSKEGYDGRLKELHARDTAFIEQTRNFENIGFAVSYVQTAEEIQLFRHHSAGRPIAAKIERSKAFENLREIAIDSDCLWLCRGDLGAEANVYNLFHFEKMFIQRLELVEKPLLIAGQVLGNMIESAYPSRSEISHLGYLIENGFTGVVLSDETAIGKYPIQAVEFCRDYFNFMAS